MSLILSVIGVGGPELLCLPLYTGEIYCFCAGRLSVLLSVRLSEIVSAPYLQDGLKDFHETCVRCSPHEGDVQNPCPDHTGSRSRSDLKVKGLSLNFVSASYIQDGLKDFNETCVRCSPHEGDVQNPCLDHTGSRSCLKVKGLSHRDVY